MMITVVFGNKIVEKPEGSWGTAIKETAGDVLSLTPMGGAGKGMSMPILAARTPVKQMMVSFIKGYADAVETITTHLPKGFKKADGSGYSMGQKVYTDGKRWISPDKTTHKGGVWKLWDKEKNVGKDVNRITTDANLKTID